MMKKNLSFGVIGLIVLATLTVLFSAAPVEAHPPSSVSIEYDMEEELLTVDVTHSVGDPQTHFIYNVVVEVDGDVVIDENYNSQPDETIFQYTYELSVEEGSTIVTTAYCNQQGSGSDTIQVEEEVEDDDTPGFLFPLLGSGTAFALILYKKKR